MTVIRKAVLSDASDVFRAETEYIDCPWTLAQIEEETQKRDAIFLVAEENGVFAGYMSCDIIIDCCDINNIAVEEKFRRNGIARALIAEAERMAISKGATEAVLTVREDNAPAVALYNSVGFTAINVRRGYYKGKNGLIMTKKF